MKNIYKLFALGIVVMLISTNLHAGAGNLPSPSTPKYTLYPPTNLNLIPMEVCFAYLSWNKPQDPGGLTPPGLLGYRIYRDGVFIHYIAGPDTLEYFDYIEDAGIFTDSVTAYYDLTSYGYPGEFGESLAAWGNVWVSCGQILPFFEEWNGGSFGFQMWSFSPVQGNWIFNSSQGNPVPTASFMGAPEVNNYDTRLQSTHLDGNPWLCANIYLEYDSRIIQNNPTSQEKMITEIQYNDTWYSKDTLVNEASTDWIHHSIDISEITGKSFRIGFRAKGTNSPDIVEWDIDNIKVYPVCFKPPDFSLERVGHQVNLSWGKACTLKKYIADNNEFPSLLGYNIYRTDGSGQPPFNKINPTYVVDTAYTDYFPSSFFGTVCYYITAVYQDTSNPGNFLCEPPSDTLCADLLAGITGENNSRLHIFPNPVEDILNIESAEPITGVEILNLLGDKVYSDSFPGKKNVNIQFESNPSGIYVLKIKGKEGLIVRKVIKN